MGTVDESWEGRNAKPANSEGRLSDAVEGTALRVSPTCVCCATPMLDRFLTQSGWKFSIVYRTEAQEFVLSHCCMI